MAIDVVANNENDLLTELAKYPNKQVIVDFWAEWCGPCRAVSPMLEEIEAEAEDVVLLKVNVDNNASVAAAYGIQSIPTLMFFKDGVVNGEPVIGVAPKTTITGRYS